MAYEKFDPDKNDFVAIAQKFNGNLKQISKHFNISRNTIFEYLKRDKEANEIIENVRGHNTIDDVEQAEFVMRYALANYKNNMHYAMRAAEKILDKKGYIRGWGLEPEMTKQLLQVISKGSMNEPDNTSK